MNFKDFEEHISDVILQRGKLYFESGAVQELSKEKGHWLAEVQGSERYDVSVKGIRSIKEWSCDCPYDGGPICKHVTALLYAVQANQTMNKSAKPAKKKSQIDEIFKKAKPEELLSFFKKNLRFNKDLKQKLLTEFIALLEDTDADRYNKVVDAMIKNAEDRSGYIDYRSGKKLSTALKRFLKQAQITEQKKNYVDTLAICAAVILKIPNLLLYVDDSSGSLDGTCYEALKILDGLLGKPIAPAFKDQIFEFVLHAFEKNETDFDFKDDLLGMLLDYEWEKEQLVQIQQVIKKTSDNLKGNYIEYSQAYYIDLLIFIAKKLKEEDQVNTLIDQYIHFPRIRQIKLNQLLEAKDYEAARRLIFEGIKVAESKKHPGTVKAWKEQLMEISLLEENGEMHQQLLKEAFLKHREMKYFTQLRSNYDTENWPKERDQLIKELLADKESMSYQKAYTIGHIYVEENLWDRLLQLLQDKKTPRYLLNSFAPHLYSIYPEEMLSFYKPQLINMAKQASTRPEYRNLANSLKVLLEIKGGQALAEELLKDFRSKYNSRPAMMDELSKVLG